MNEENYFKKRCILGKFINDMPEEEKIKQGVICQCRQMKMADVYEWCADNEIKNTQLQQENTQLKENWDKLEEWIKEVDFLHFNKAILLDKMKELKGNTKK